MVVSMKPVSTQPILYVSAQMRMLRALKKTGLDFSKVSHYLSNVFAVDVSLAPFLQFLMGFDVGE